MYNSIHRHRHIQKCTYNSVLCVRLNWYLILLAAITLKWVTFVSAKSPIPEGHMKACIPPHSRVGGPAGRVDFRV